MEEELAFLLRGNLGLGILNIHASFFVLEGLQEVLRGTTLHVEVGRLHRFELDGHGPIGLRSLEDVVLLEDLLLVTSANSLTAKFRLLDDRLGVGTSDVPIDEHDDNDEEDGHRHFHGEKLRLSLHVAKYLRRVAVPRK